MFKSAIIRAFYLGVMFLANLVMANLLLPYHYGTLTLMILNASVFSIFSGFGTDSVILYSLTSKKWNLGQAFTFTRNSLIIQIVLFVLFEVASISLSEKTFLSQNEISFIIPEAAFFIGLIITDKLVILFYSIHKAYFANCILAISAIIFFSSLMFFKFNSTVEASNLFWLFSMQCLFQGLALLLVLYLKNKVSFSKVSMTTIVGALKLSSLVMITNIIQFFAYRIDYYFIQKFYSDFEVGVFAQSNKLANLMWIVPNIFALLLIPKFNQLTNIQNQSIFKLALIKNSILAVVTLIAGYIAFSIILKPEYATGLKAFYIMLPGYFCWATVIYFGAYFSFLGKFHYNMIASAFCFLAIISADLLFIPKYGINGAAFSNTIAYSATLILYFILYIRITEIQFSSILKFHKSDFQLLLNALK